MSKMQDINRQQRLLPHQLVVDREQLDWFGGAKPRTPVAVLGKEQRQLAGALFGSGVPGRTLSTSDLAKLREYFHALGESLGFKGAAVTEKQLGQYAAWLEALDGDNKAQAKGGEQRLELSGEQLKGLTDLFVSDPAQLAEEARASRSQEAKASILEHGFERKQSFEAITGRNDATRLPRTDVAPKQGQLTGAELQRLTGHMPPGHNKV